MPSIPYRLFLCFSLVLSIIPVRAQETDAPQTIPEQNTSNTVTDSSVRQYLDQIAEQEKLYGAYDPQLSEQLLGLGLLYQNLELYAEAGKVLNRALHIRKVNDGLQSMTQAPILNALIKVNTDAGNWKELDQNYHGLLWLYQRNLKSDDPAFLPVILAVGKWKLEAYSNGLVSDNSAFMLDDLVEIFRTTVETMEHHYGENDPRLIVPLKILSLAYYQQVNEVFNTSIEEFHGDGNRYTYRQRCVVLPRSNQVVCGTEEVPNTNYYTSKQQNKDIRVAEQMHRVRSTLDRIATVCAANSATHPDEYVMALVNLGDWYFIYDKHTTAVEKYNQAYQILTDSGSEQALINKIFGKPVRIPVMSTALSIADTEDNGEVAQPYVRLAFNVTVNGRANSIQVLEESDPKSYQAHKTARAIVKSAVFRPQLQNGKLVATEGAELLLSGDILLTNYKQYEESGSPKSASKLRNCIYCD